MGVSDANLLHLRLAVLLQSKYIIKEQLTASNCFKKSTATVHGDHLR